MNVVIIDNVIVMIVAMIQMNLVLLDVHPIIILMLNHSLEIKNGKIIFTKDLLIDNFFF